MPGSVTYSGEPTGRDVVLRGLRYAPDVFEERELAGADEIAEFLQQDGTKWISLDGLSNTTLLEEIGRRLLFHPLLLEDIANTTQRTKLEEDEDRLFVFMRDFERNPDTQSLDDSQLTIALGEGFVFTFCEQEPSEFQTVRERLRSGQGLARANGADYLLYRLLDILVDQYFVALDELGSRLDALQSQVMESPNSREILQDLFDTRHELLGLRSSIMPLRDVLSALERRESGLIHPATRAYLRDVYDHALHVAESIDTLRELDSATLEVYLSRLSLRQNDVMRVLTVISTIFLPLTFLAGIWGMNFLHMPELRWTYGYLAALGVMAIAVAVMITYFKKRNWL